MSAALIRVRSARARVKGIDMVQDYKLGLRMLLKYPGLTIAGGLALAIAIGIGAGWYDLTRDFLRPTIPLPGGDRIVEIEMRNLAGGDERRLLHNFSGGSGIAVGNSVLVLFVALSDEVDVADVTGALMTSGVMLTVGLLACIEPARRALRIQPTDALKEA